MPASSAPGWKPGDPCPLAPDPHPHGDERHHRTGCRCDDTRTAHLYRVAQLRRTRAGHRNADTLTDAAPVIAHLRELVRRGFSPRLIAESTGVPSGTVGHLMSDKPTRRVRTKDTAEPLMNFDPPSIRRVRKLPGSPDYTLAHPSMLRLRALGSLGYSLDVITRYSPCPDGTDPVRHRHDVQRELHRIRSGDPIRTRVPLHDAVAAAYEDLWNTPAVPSTTVTRRHVTRTLRLAESRRWPFPMDLDDDRLSDMTYQPRRQVYRSHHKKPDPEP